MSDGTIGTLLIIGSVFFDVLANICLKKSQGFKYKLYGFLAISLVGFAFLCLAYAISIMDLSIAYALFGACGLLLTTIIFRSTHQAFGNYWLNDDDYWYCFNKNDLNK